MRFSDFTHDELFVVLRDVPVTGITIVGPFESNAAAEQYLKQEPPNGDSWNTWIVPLIQPSIRTQPPEWQRYIRRLCQATQAQQHEALQTDPNLHPAIKTILINLENNQ